jgi:hypothetical protein
MEVAKRGCCGKLRGAILEGAHFVGNHARRQTASGDRL